MNYRFLLAAASILAAAVGSQAQDINLGEGRPQIALPRMAGANLQTLVLRRPEVQKHLDLNLNQRNTLSEILDPAKGGRFAIQVESGPHASDKSPEEQIREQVNTQETNRDLLLRNVLTESQVKRLHELTLQWRGPMAIADDRLTKSMSISKEARAAAAKATAAYEEVKSAVMQRLAKVNEESPGAISVRLDLSELDNPLSPNYKELDAARDRAEAKILAALSSLEKAAWRAAKGEPFTFRSDKRGTRF